MLLMTNVDNVNLDQIPNLIEQLMHRGARNVHVVSAMTKKGRQEYILFIDVPEDQKEVISWYLAAEIGTLGVRALQAHHTSFPYKLCQMNVKLKDESGKAVWQGIVNVKLVMNDRGAIISARVEYEDLKEAARGVAQEGSAITFYEMKQMIETEALSLFGKTKHRVEIDPVT